MKSCWEKYCRIFFLGVVTALSYPAAAEEKLDLRSTAAAMRNSCVDILIDLQYNEKCDVPTSLGIFCSGCNFFHFDDLEDLLADRIPVALNGFLVAPDLVLAPDIMLDGAGVKNITALLNGERVPAQIIMYYPQQGALLLKLAKPFANGKVLTFAEVKSGEKMYYYSRIAEENAGFVSRMNYFYPDGDCTLSDTQRLSRRSPGFSVVLNSQGQVLALIGNNNEFVDDEDWSLPYTKWEGITAEEFEFRKVELQNHIRKCVLPVTIYLRDIELSRRQRLMNGESNREQKSCVFRLPDGRFFMPLLSSPWVNSRIEKVVITTEAGPVKASCVKILREFGGIILEPEKEIEIEPLAAAIGSFDKNLGMQIFAARVVGGDKIDVELVNDAFGAAVRGYHNYRFGQTLKLTHRDLIFSLKGELLGVMVNPRAFGYDRMVPFISAEDLLTMLNDQTKCVSFRDLCNPSDTLATLGIEYQRMNKELAQSMNVAHLTQNGDSGLLVSYVYPGSSAEKMNLKNGDILFGLITSGGGAPIVFKSYEHTDMIEEKFPWEQLDNVPEMYFSEIPEPWPGIQNALNLKLTHIGIGQPAELLVIIDGKLERKQFTIEASPVYWEIAPRYESPALGLEVREITYELRRYFRMEKDAAGVIVSDVFAGSSASTAGVRPFEIITAVNDKPVYTVQEFQQAVADKSEVRLSVRRLAASRIVTVKPKVGPLR